MHASDTVLPIATCQRLWHVDLARVTQESQPEIDLFGLNVNQRLSANEAAALSYLKGRRSRFREVRNLAAVFALHTDDELRERFKSTLAAFPDELPYFLEKERASEDRTQSLLESARIWAGWGDAENYRTRDLLEEPGAKIIEYQAPEPLPQTVQNRLATSRLGVQDYSVMVWATKSLEADAIQPSINLATALAHVRPQEKPGLFDTVAEADLVAQQSATSATAALVVRFGGVSNDDTDWAWDVFARVETRAEPEG